MPCRTTAVWLLYGLFACCAVLRAQASKPSGLGEPIPKTWDDAELSTLEIPLAQSSGWPRHVSASYYYRIPVRPIFKSYDVYAPGREPPGYSAWLKSRPAEVIWDNSGHAPTLKSESDWIKAGEIVFDSAVVYDGITTADDVQNPDWYKKTDVQLTRDGIMPFYRYVIRQQGKLELGRLACANCHTRLLPDGSTLKGRRAIYLLTRFALTQS
jgi:hypothetical protein